MPTSVWQRFLVEEEIPRRDAAQHGTICNEVLMATVPNDISDFNIQPPGRVADCVTLAARRLFEASIVLSDAAGRCSDAERSKALKRMSEHIDAALPAMYRLGRIIRRRRT